MSSTTPTNFDESQRSVQRSSSKSRSGTPPPRPTTPLRPPSRGSLRSSHTPTRGGSETNPLDGLEPAFAELADGMADLEANFMHLQLMRESLSRFNECFASFLHGMKVNAFCVDFPEAPIPESFRRAKDNPRFNQAMDDSSTFNHSLNSEPGPEVDHTFLTTDTSFVENPPAAAAVPEELEAQVGLQHLGQVLVLVEDERVVLRAQREEVEGQHDDECV
ncbi:MAG: hypothetical protein Q9159_000878 [Coniocarpon cinnabarinum]